MTSLTLSEVLQTHWMSCLKTREWIREGRLDMADVGLRAMALGGASLLTEADPAMRCVGRHMGRAVGDLTQFYLKMHEALQ